MSSWENGLVLSVSVVFGCGSEQAASSVWVSSAFLCFNELQ